MCIPISDPKKAEKSTQKTQKSTVLVSQKSIFSKISNFHLRLIRCLKRLFEWLKPTKPAKVDWGSILTKTSKMHFSGRNGQNPKWPKSTFGSGVVWQRGLGHKVGATRWLEGHYLMVASRPFSRQCPCGRRFAPILGTLAFGDEKFFTLF